MTEQERMDYEQANTEWERRLAAEQIRLQRNMSVEEIAIFYERIRGDALGYGYWVEIEG